MILTEGGNLLRFHETLKKPYFQSPRGEFLRECSNDEFDWLCREGVLVETWDARFEDEPKEFPAWHFLKSVRVMDDFTDYQAGTSSNVGNYSFNHFHDWYVAKYPDGKWKFSFVENYSTSAEFNFDELAGKFQSDLGEIYLSNCRSQDSYRTQIGRIWDEESECWTYSVPEVVEKIGTISDFNHLWNEFYHYLPSKIGMHEEEKHYPALSLTDRKEIVSILKELGCDLRQEFKQILNRSWVKNNRR